MKWMTMGDPPIIDVRAIVKTSVPAGGCASPSPSEPPQMKSRLRRTFRNFAFKTRRLIGLEKLLVLQGEIRAHQIRTSGEIETLADTEFSVFSQWGEDGIIAWLVHVLRPEHRSFVEFGVEDYRESNTRFLLMSQNWSGLIIDGSQDNIAAVQSDDIAYKNDLRTRVAFIDRDNINNLVDEAKLGDRLGLLSTDIDGIDYWVLEQIRHRATIITVEYNQLFGDEPLSVPYDSGFIRLKKHWSGMYWGASLSAFRHLLEGRGYVFVGTNRAGTNAFFVDCELMPMLKGRLKQVLEWPCVMREVRNKDGSMAYKTYAEARALVRGLPVVNVVTGETTILS